MKFGSGDFKYELVENWAKLPDGVTFKDVCTTRIDENDVLYLFNRGTYPLMVYDRNGNYLKSWGQGVFSFVHGGCIGPDNSLFCVDAGGHTVSKYTRDGKMIFMLGEKGKPSDTGYFQWTPEAAVDFEENLNTITHGDLPFNNPTNAFVASNGDLYVSDGYGNARIHKFSAEGKLLYSWGEPGRGPGQFRVPHSVWVDKHDRIWVADRQNGRLQIFDLEGKFIDQWTGLDWPCDLYIDENENVFVAELQRRITIFDKDGKVIVRFKDTEEDKNKATILAPHGIVLDSKGDLYVSEVANSYTQVNRGGRAIQKFARI